MSVKMSKQIERKTKDFLEKRLYCAMDYKYNHEYVLSKLNKGMINFSKQSKGKLIVSLYQIGIMHNSIYKKGSAPDIYDHELIIHGYSHLGHVPSEVKVPIFDKQKPKTGISF